MLFLCLLYLFSLVVLQMYRESFPRPRHVLVNVIPMNFRNRVMEILNPTPRPATEAMTSANGPKSHTDIFLMTFTSLRQPKLPPLWRCGAASHFDPSPLFGKRAAAAKQDAIISSSRNYCSCHAVGSHSSCHDGSERNGKPLFFFIQQSSFSGARQISKCGKPLAPTRTQ